MDRARVVPLALALLLLLAAGPAAASTRGGFYAPGDLQPDAVSIVAALHANGDATWTVNYRVRLATDNETAAFHSLQRDIRNNTTAYRRPFAERINATVNASENATGRAMTADNYTINTHVQPAPEYGVVTYTFDWHGFATANGTTIHAGDAISGFYVDNSTTLQFSWPTGYRLASADPAGDSASATSIGWSGRHDFTNGQPRVVVTSGPAPTTTTPANGGRGLGGPLTVLVPLAIFLGLVVLAAAVVLAARAGVLEGALDALNGAGESPDEPVAGDGNEPPAELLSNEEQVERFLAERGGRAKQQELVAATGWTEAKTSQVLKGMREDGRVESFRIGRENVLRLPEEDESDDV